jgi:long-chain acyl-CoA synthetase
MNIGSLPTRHARYRPDQLGFVFEDRRLSYRDFNAEINRLCNAMLSTGLKKGDHIFAALSNSSELMTLYWMAAKTGIVIVPASTLLQTSGLKSLIAGSDSVMVFADARFAEMLDEIRGELPAVRNDGYILVGGEASAPEGYRTYEDLIGSAGGHEPPEAGLSDDDVYNIMYTSGTTGDPKGIIHTHYVRSHYCTTFAASFRMSPESIVLHAGSIVFNGAMIDLMPWMFVGCTYILHRAFDAKAVLDAIEAEKATHIVLVPAQFIEIINHPEFNPARLSSLEMILSVGAPLPLAYKERLNAELPGIFYELYGLTEGMCTVLDCKDSMRKAGSVGVPPALFEVKIIDEDGHQLPSGEIGEICGRAPVIMPGYYKRPDLTEKAIVDGWLLTGDVGCVDEDGFLYLVDRIKDMIISGGVNVYPKDIEEVLNRHDHIVEAAVFGAPDEKWGECPIAVVRVAEGSTTSPEDLMAWTNAHVGAKFQRLKDLVIMEHFPRTMAGKTLKRELKQQYVESQDHEVEEK